MIRRTWPNVASRDKGAAVVEFAIVALPMLIVTFMVVQAALVYYARSTALAAATQGANAARAYNAPSDAGQLRANNFLNQAGGGLRNHDVIVVFSGTDVTVTVTGNAVPVLPGFNFGVAQSASGPRERFVP
ncbi:TadE family protein [Allorhizocola rhizosphaerae]|uniref:TadE family protein n=1 Tax=Allorhizocola rhizosphaerae TaxID=1872709 RepID=UPI000E3EA6E3|nr:TadE/TadG family type IV pilus assembly protein [Allorhizocola rhizosphaerae]